MLPLMMNNGAAKPSRRIKHYITERVRAPGLHYDTLQIAFCFLLG